MNDETDKEPTPSPADEPISPPTPPPVPPPAAPDWSSAAGSLEPATPSGPAWPSAAEPASPFTPEAPAAEPTSPLADEPTASFADEPRTPFAHEPAWVPEPSAEEPVVDEPTAPLAPEPTAPFGPEPPTPFGPEPTLPTEGEPLTPFEPESAQASTPFGPEPAWTPEPYEEEPFVPEPAWPSLYEPFSAASSADESAEPTPPSAPFEDESAPADEAPYADEASEADEPTVASPAMPYAAGQAAFRGGEREYYREPGAGGQASGDDDEASVESGPAAKEESPPLGATGDGEKRKKRISGAGMVIGVLLALLGFSLVVQVKSNSTDAAYASAREGDLLQIMSDLDGAERRLQQDIASLEATKRELASGAAGQEAAQEAAKARADDLGILAGTLPARGPGVQVLITEVTGTIRAASLLNAVQELRGGGAEAIQIDGGGGSVRVTASTSFVDADGGIRIDGRRLTGPYTILAIGEPDTLSDAVQFAGGVVPRVKEDGGNVIVNKRDVVDIKEVRSAPDLEYARPVS